MSETLNDKLEMMIDFSKVDRIVTDLDFLFKLTEWGREYSTGLPDEEYNLIKISCFDEIIWNILSTDVYMQISGNDARFATIQNGKIDAAWIARWDEENAISIYSSEDNEKVPTDLMANFTMTFVTLMHYVREYRGEPGSIQEETFRERKVKKPKKGKGQKRVTYLTRREVRIKYIDKAEKRQWTRRIEGSWGVRAHPRTYHRGTEKEFTIWIDKQTRGSGEYTPKEYRVTKPREKRT